MSRQEGHSSITVLIIVLFLSSSVIGVLLFLRISFGQTETLNEYYSEKELLREEVDKLIAILADDPTPEADSPFDPVWSYLETREDSEIELSLEDLSSRFNLNFIRTQMLGKSLFSRMFTEGFSADDLKLYRGEQGFFSDLHEGYGQFFDEDVLDKYFTTYSYANFNVTYEDSLKKLYEIRVSEAGSHVFLGLVQQHISGKTLADEEKLKQILGFDSDSLYPLINTSPLLNVNFAGEKILHAILNYPYGGETHEDSMVFYETLISDRAVGEINLQRLRSIIEVEEDYGRIYEYLGTTTWFWRIKAKINDLALNVVIGRTPGNQKDTVQYSVIEWNISQSPLIFRESD